VDFVIDNSIVMSWCFADEKSRYADSVLDRLSELTAVTPSIWPLELGNVLLVAERRKRMSETDSARFLALINDLPIITEQETPERMLKEVLALARKSGLSSYDASYLDLAMRTGLPIATLDKALKKAANKIQLPIFSP
jgi:predicted nucleic acid-binding protein